MTTAVPMPASPNLRRDLRFLPQWRSGRRWWIVHDPIKNNYQRIGDDDLQALVDGRAPTSLWVEAEQMGWVEGGCVAPNVPSWRSWLAWRLPGVPMDSIAGSLVKHTAWIMSFPAVIAWLLFILSAGITLAIHWERAIASLPALNHFLSAKNAILLLAITVGSKIIHELGHALACKRWGARVGDIGIIILCGTPCLFCDVSSTWGLPERKQRAAVMAAGMYVEWIVAAIATYGWWLSSTGDFNTLCLNIMIVCGISTFVFNANPLMRYDGYHILADALDLPNLSAAAQKAWRELIINFLAQLRITWRHLPLAVYHLAALVYRTIVSITIAVWLTRFLAALYVLPLAIVAGFACVLNALWPWLNGWKQWRQGKQEWQRITSYHRRIITGTILVALIAGFTFRRDVSVKGEGAIEVVHASSVFVPQGGGRVESVLVCVGEQVIEGQPIAVLQNAELDLKILQLQHRVDQLKTKQINLLKRALNEPQLLEQKSTVNAAYQAALKQLELALEEQKSLELRSPVAGIVLPPDLERARLPDRTMEASYVPGGNVWCRVGDPNQCVAQLRIDRDERRHIGTGNSVELVSSTSPGLPAKGQVLNVLEPSGNATMESEDPNSSPPFVTVLCTVPETIGWKPGSQVKGWITGPNEAVWTKWSRDLFQAIAP